MGGLPIAVASTPRAGNERATGATPTVRRVSVQVVDRVAASRSGVDGPMFTLRRVDGEAAGGRVKLTTRYGQFAHAYGGDWGSRLRVVAMPACALTAPDKPECRKPAEVRSINNQVEQTVSAEVDLAATGAAVFALTAGDSSTKGDYKATKLALSSSWETALSSGGFSWSYPIRSPETPGGLGPQVALSYSSQAVDGRTSATNNQGSWIGEGFAYEPGYIERRYKPCSDDGHTGSGDRCWASYNGSIVLSGRSGDLVKIDNDTWKLSNDDGSKVQRMVGTVNGDDNGEYWKVTSTDGTQYFFGLGRLPGWSAGKEQTESTWTAPVYGDDSGEPCYQATGFDDSYCDQAWRWNLDYVVDPRGNVISYFYDRETNHFARGGRTDVDGAAYHRGGYLARIDYGQRAGQVYATDAPARVVFSTAERCLPGGGVDCDPQDLTEATAASWPDVPEDLICPADTHCEHTQGSATFFTRKRLTKIQTELRNATGWSPVESWALEHEFKANDDASRTLWLKKITHVGHWGGATVTMPATQLDGIQLPNRIVRDGDNLGPLIRYRLSTVKTDSGAQMTINYADVDCDKSALPTPGSSTKRCFPVKWNPLGGDDDDEVTDWFHKYVVDSVVEDDLVGGNDDMVTAFEYVGDAAWRKSEPDGITKTEDLTWADWRGYQQVTVRTGNGQSMPGRVEHFFLRGMSGGKVADGSRPTVTRSDSTGTSYTDHDQWSGHELETILYNGPDIVSKTIKQPWRRITHTRTESWGTQESAMIRADVARTLTAMPDDAQGNAVWRETRTNTEFDPTWGRTVEVEDLGDVAEDDDDKCTHTWYVDNPDTYMYSLGARVRTVADDCGVTNPDLTTKLLSDTRTSYDLHAWGQPPVEGSPTRVEQLDHFDGANVVYLTVSETTSLDDYGRDLSVKDARAIEEGRPYATLTEYTETFGLTTQVKVTNAADHVTTTTMDPAFNQVTATVDPNLRRTDLGYDALGRLTGVWLPDRDKSQGATPNVKYTYSVRADKTSVITTERINNDGSYRASHELYDGMLRVRQTQMPGVGGWLLSDTYHDGHGRAYKNNAAYLAVGTPGDVPIVTPEGSVNGQTTLTFDDAGRQIVETFSVAGDARWVTTTSYDGNRVSVDPPAGDTPTTTVTDARGQMTELHEYEGASPTGAADVTHYTYTAAGSIDTVTDPLGNRWNFDYNQRNQKILAQDPDSGDTRYTYNASGDVKSTTDARNEKVSHKYDALGRKVETWRGDVGTGTKLSSWTYDTLTGAKGQLHYSQRFVDGQTYTTVNATLDVLYRPLKVRYTFPAGGVGSLLGKSYEFTTAYNVDGTVQSAGMPEAGGLAAEAVTTTYDSLLRPTSLTGTTSYVTSVSYGNIGELLQAELHDGGTGKKAWLTYEYERGTARVTRARVDRQSIATVDRDARYGYDAAGNILTIADTPSGGQADIQCFTYDGLRRLTRAWSHDGTAGQCADGVAATGVSGPARYHESWSFDKVGNRDVETIHSTSGGTDTVRDYTLPAQGGSRPHSLTRVDETGPNGNRTYTYGYDPAGNTTCRPNTTATNDCTSPTPSGEQILTWDAEGHLASSKPNGGQATTYVYDAGGSRIARKEPGGKTTIYLPGMELTLNGSVVTGTRYYSFGDKAVALRNASGVSYQVADHHGTAACTINAATGAITWRRTTPYGGGRGTPPGSWPDQKGFVGGTKDATGLTHLGAREYDPVIGRFVSVDPVADFMDPQQLQGYVYGTNNPVTFSDPSGLKPSGKNRNSRKTVSGHDATVLAYGMLIWVFFLFQGIRGEVTVDIKGTKNYQKNTIPGASGNTPGNPGEADIIFWGEDIIYVWEVKPGNGYGRTEGPVDLARYIKHLQADPRAKGRIVLPGPQLPTIPLIPSSEGTMRAWTENGAPGMIFYGRAPIPKAPKNPPPPVTAPTPVPRPLPTPVPGPLPIEVRVPVTSPVTPGYGVTPSPNPWGPYGTPLPACQGWLACHHTELMMLAPVAVPLVAAVVLTAPAWFAAGAAGAGVGSLAFA
ncbi:RHS repeat-associated core domain-containing protein [Catellatospora aurea]|uniref:RHS repeat-associated core domain-containing protein n=1 Tax=Catellatospora aurea TaxID=1337874 RepID=A0ABW2H012_9ACTN